MGATLGHDFDLAAAAEVVSRCVGESVVLEPASGPRGRHRSSVLRCHVTRSAAAAPSTVIVKQAPAEPGQAELALCNEWAALTFLSRLELDPPVSPALYGGDRSARLLVVEDLGDGDGVVDALLGSDPAAAKAALVAFTRALGRMHAASIGRLEVYRRLRLKLGPLGGESIIDSSALRGRFEAALRGAGVRLGAAADDVESVIERITEPGPFLALVHGDACPSNERMRGSDVVLLDFGTAGLRHALLDGVCGAVAFPTCWCARRLPQRMPALMEQSYRSELVRGCPAAADDRSFALAAATGCAYWLIETTTIALLTLPSGDSQWGISTVGERLALRAQLFTELADAVGDYGALANLVSHLVEVLGLTDARMPLYPAFGGPALPAPSQVAT